MTSLFSPTARSSEFTPALDKLRAANEQLERHVLDNGLTVLLKRDSSAPVVALQIWVGTGSIHEGENLGAGLSHYMEHMIFKGTPTRGPADITRQIDEAGGEINAYTAHDRTVFYADLPSRNWKVGVDVLSDAVMNASLPEDEWAREKEVILREFAMGNDSPPRVHGKLLYSTAYRIHPYRVPVIGYEDVFRTMTRDHLAAFFHEHYVPDNMIVVMVGDIDVPEVLAYLNEVFAPFKRRARQPPVLPNEPVTMSPRIARETGPYQVTRVHWAYHTVSLDHPDAPALDLLAGILGDGRSSILYDALREKEHLVHSINAWSHTPAQGGLFGISATFDPGKEPAVLAAIHRVLRETAGTPFTDEQIAKARRNHIISELGSLQTMSGQASSYGAGEYYTGNPRFSEQYLESILKVDDAKLHEVLDRYVIQSHETLAILSPAPSGAVTNVVSDDATSNLMTRLELSNGIPLIVREDRRLPFIFISVAMEGGLLSENTTNNGITQLAADLLTRGTESRSGADIAREIESRGASLSGYAGRNSMGMNAQGLVGDADLLMELLADCLIRPQFADEEIIKQKSQQVASLRQQAEQPMYLAQEKLRELIFADHPYRMNTLGSEQSIQFITRDEVQSFYRRHLTPDNMAISIFGDIDAVQAQALAEKYLGALAGASGPARVQLPANPTLPASGTVEGPFEQAILLMGYPGVDLKDSRNDALNILQKALSGLSSDLAIEVREKRGLVYFIGALSMSGLDPGLFGFYAGTTTGALDEVQQLVGEQVARISTEGIRTDEFERARAQLIASHDMSLQNTGDIAQLCALNELYGIGYDHAFALPERLMALTPKDVQQAAASLFLADRLAVSRLIPSVEKAPPP